MPENQPTNEDEPAPEVPQLPELDGTFFAVIKTGIAHTSWARNDFQSVERVEGQLAALEKFVEYQQHQKIEAGELILLPDGRLIKPNPKAKPVEKEPAKVEPVTPSTPTPVEPLPTPSESATSQPDVEPAQASRPMPDEIAEQVKAGIEIAKNPPKNPPNVQVSAEPLPTDRATFDAESAKL